MKSFLNVFDKIYPAAFWVFAGFMLTVIVLSMLTGCGATSHFRVATDVNRVNPDTQEAERSGMYGTGFFVNRTGLALTAAHLFRGRLPGTTRAQVWWSGKNGGLPVVPVVIDWTMDIALVQVATHKSKPVKPLCAEMSKGEKAVAFGAPEYKVLRKKGTIFNMFVEWPPCEAHAYKTGVNIRCANEEHFIHTSNTRLNQSTSPEAPAAIIEATSDIRSGFSGGSLLYKSDEEKACTAGVIIQQRDISRRTRAIHPLSSPAIARYLIKHAPKFVENFTN